MLIAPDSWRRRQRCRGPGVFRLQAYLPMRAAGAARGQTDQRTDQPTASPRRRNWPIKSTAPR